MLINILLITILISFVTMGARIITDFEMIGYPIRFYALKLGGITKPLITCVVCMPSVWGVGIHLLVIGNHTPELYYIPLEILSACCINAFLWKLYHQ